MSEPSKFARLNQMQAERNHGRDPIARLILDSTAEEFTEWLVQAKGLDPGAVSNVVSNLREAFKWHRLQGRLDRNATASLIAELWMMRRSAALFESLGYQVVVLTEEEASVVGGIVASYVREQGSIYNDSTMAEQEERLRRKLSI